MHVERRERFDELKQYKSVHNHCNVPQKEGDLGKWEQTVGGSFGLLDHNSIKSTYKVFNVNQILGTALDAAGSCYVLEEWGPRDNSLTHQNQK